MRDTRVLIYLASLSMWNLVMSVGAAAGAVGYRLAGGKPNVKCVHIYVFVPLICFATTAIVAHTAMPRSEETELMCDTIVALLLISIPPQCATMVVEYRYHR